MRNAFFLLCASYFALNATIVAADDSYPRPEFLIEAAALSQPEVAKEFVILDVRSQKDYDEGHLPKAQRVEAAAWSKAFADGDDADGWGKRIGDLGIGDASKVVVYDNASSKDAARIWWILRYWGVQDVAILNRGWTAWKSGQLPIQTDTPQPVAAANFQAVPASERLANKGSVLESLTNKSLQLVDARSDEEFCGSDKLSNKRGGAIPGARHLEWSDLIDEETQRFKKPDELRELFQKTGIDLDKTTATYCQSGGRASVLAFGLELMGAEDIRNYYRGWSEWGNSDETPVEVVEPKQE